MFRDFKDKLSSEYERAKTKIQTQAQNLVINAEKSGSPSTMKRSDSITSTDSRTITETSQTSDTSKCSEPGFSLVDLDDEQSNPPLASTPTTSKRAGDADSFFKTAFISNIVSNFVPQSDIESEYESESGANKNLDNISKEQLLELCHRLKARSVKYREKWGEVVKVYRDTMVERDKLKNVLAETQDKAIRRINELKEQCNLEQEAKRHLEENLQMTIEEKDEQIKALQTKLDVINTGDLINLTDDKRSEYTARITTLESLLAKSNESLKSNKEHVEVLTKENEQLVKFKESSEKLEKEMEMIRKLKDSASSSFGEAKQKLHDELESRNIIIKELKDQLEKSKIEIKKRTNELKTRAETIKSLNEKVASIESANEAEKAALADDLCKSKTAAINLMKEQFDKQMETATSELRAEVDKLARENTALKEQDKATLLEEQSKQVEHAHQLNETLSKEVQDCNRRLALASEELSQARAERQQIEHQLKLELQRNQEKVEHLCQQVEQLNQEIETLAQLRSEFESTQTLLEEAQTRTQEATREMETMRKQLEETRETLQKVRDEKQLLETNQAHASGEDSNQQIKLELAQKASQIQEMEQCLIVKDSLIAELSRSESQLKNEIASLNEKMNNFDASIDERLKMVKEEHDKNLKMLADSKTVLVKLREECQHLQAEIDSYKSQNNELNQQNTQLNTEIASLNSDLTTFKNRMIHIFYSSYADSDIHHISSLDYNQFLQNIQATYEKTIQDNRSLAVNLERLQAEAESQRQSMAEERGKHESSLSSLRQLNDNLLKEIANLKNNLARQIELQNRFEEKNVEVEALKEKNESLLEDIRAVREDLEACREELKSKVQQIRVQEDQIYEVGNQLECKQNQLEQIKKDNQVCESKQLELEAQLKQERDNNGERDELSAEMNELRKQNASYLEEITKIKSNAKGILESKQKLQDKLKLSEANLANLRQEYQILSELKNQHQTLCVEMDKLKQEHQKRESKWKNKVSELESVLAGSNANEDEINKLKDACDKLQAKLLEKENIEQELRNQVMALGEKIKTKEENDRDLQQEMKSNKSYKEQIHKQRIEIGELKNQMNEMKVKHEETIDKLYKQLEVRESQLDESLLNANSQHHSTSQELLRSKAEISKLRNSLEELLEHNRQLAAQSEQSGEKNESMVAKYEMQIETLQSQLEAQKQEMALQLNRFDEQENRFISQHNTRLGELENEVSEKNVALEEVHEYYQQRLKAKESELKHLHEQLTSSDKNNYQINALQNSILQYHEENARLKEMLNVHKDKNGSDLENCAILGVHLPQPTEYEYLRNILLEFMMGREPLTLVKVISAVMRFSNEETQQILKKQETLYAQHLNSGAKRKT